MPGLTLDAPPAQRPPMRDDIEPVAHESVDRFVTGAAVVLPFLALGVAAWQLWGHALRASNVLLFVTFYVATALGVTVGFHRHLTHRSFKTTRAVRVSLSLLGSAAVEGPVISWVADHRKHHAFSDHEGDPHSPHVGHGGGWRGALGGLWHAHIGWMFVHDQRGKHSRYAPDLLADPALRFIHRTFLLWVGLGLALPFALPSMGEAWHNNHHAFPTSAAHGLRRWEIDPSALVIRALEAAGLAWDVQRVSREREAHRYPVATP